MRLDSVQIIDKSLNQNKAEVYRLAYNNNAMDCYNLPGTDLWGYYNATSEGCTQRKYWYLDCKIPTYPIWRDEILGTNSGSPSLSHSQYEVLRKVIYPTKGETEFNYELNTYINENGGANYDMDAPLFGGGLRISSVIDRGSDGKETKRSLIYEKGFIDHPFSADGNYTETSFTVLANRNEDNYFNGNSFVYRTRNFSNSINGDLGSNEVKYGKVSEIIGSSTGANSGKTIYYYEYANPNIYGSYSSGIDGDNGKKVLRVRRDWDNGQLTLKENYKMTTPGVYQIVSKEKSSYTLTNDSVYDNFKLFRLTTYPTRYSGGDIAAEWETRNFLGLGENNPTSNFNKYTLFGMYDYSIRTGSTYLTKKENINYYYKDGITYSDTTATSFYYDNPSNLVSREVTVTSDGKTLAKQNYYPQDYSTTSAGIKTLVDKNIVGAAIGQLMSVDGKLVSGTATKYNDYGEPVEVYAAENELGKSFTLDKNNPYNWGSLKARFDYKNNLISQWEKVDDGTKCVYLWSYNNMYPVVEIANVSYSDVEAVLGGAQNIAAFANKISPDISEIKTFINPLYTDSRTSKAMITYYTYQPLVGMASMTNPCGVTTYYEYDDSGRLKCVKDMNGKVVQQYDYHYAH